MIILRRGEITYYVKEEAVIVAIKDFQFIAYTVYPLQNRKPFYDFRKTILKSLDNEYNNIFELIKLGQRYNLKATAGRKPVIEEAT